MTHTLLLKVGELLKSPVGTNFTVSFSGPVEMEFLTTLSDISGKVELMRIDNGINAKVSDLNIDVQYECKNCLKKFPGKISFPHSERQFLLDAPKSDDPFDIYLVDKKKHQIDLTEMLRQEIILHFSQTPVCSKSCKIQWQDQDLPKDPVENKPLAILKELLT